MTFNWRTNVTKKLVIVAATLISTTTFADQDCHSLKKWGSDSSYSKGDHVWSNERGSAENGAEFSCAKDKCAGSDDKPGTSAWTLIGNCKSGTHP